MAGEKYSEMGDLPALGFLVNALDKNKGEDGDSGALFPRSDAEDLSRGARFIPGTVTLARRAGEKVKFVTQCSPCCWYWEMPDGTRVYHFDPLTYRQIGIKNGSPQVKEGAREIHFENGAGPCPECGNPHTNGGTIKL